MVMVDHHQCDDGQEDCHHHHNHHHHHHHHPHHNQCDDGEEDLQSFGGPLPPQPHELYQSQPHFYSYAPPPYFEGTASPPPFGHVTHVGHPPFNSTLESYTGVSHVAHHSSYEPHPYTPSGVARRPDENRGPDNLAGLAGRATVKVYSKAEPNYHMTIRDGKVILAPADASNDAQHWYKDEKYSTRVKDAEGHPCFALVNKATGEAMKHSVGATHPVHLIRYDPDRLDESVLWTQSKNLGDGYHAIRMLNNTTLNVDASHGDSKSGGVRDGTTIILWDWNEGDNQLWKIVPFCKPLLR